MTPAPAIINKYQEVTDKRPMNEASGRSLLACRDPSRFLLQVLQLKYDAKWQLLSSGDSTHLVLEINRPLRGRRELDLLTIAVELFTILNDEADFSG